MKTILKIGKLFFVIIFILNCSVNNFQNRISKAKKINVIYIQASILVEGDFEKSRAKHTAPRGTLYTKEKISASSNYHNGICSREGIVHLEIFQDSERPVYKPYYKTFIMIEYLGYFNSVVPYFSKSDTTIEVPLAYRRNDTFYKFNTKNMIDIELYKGALKRQNITVEYEVQDDYDPNEIWHVREAHYIKVYKSIPVLVRKDKKVYKLIPVSV